MSIPTFYTPKTPSTTGSGVTPTTTSSSLAASQPQKEAVIGTNDDAASCKLSAVNIGYYNDKYVHYFVKKPIRRPPLINRGFFSRVETIEQLTQQFFSIYSGCPTVQIVNLGCGYDTFYFRLKSRGLVKNVTYFEVDYDKVVTNKIKIIRSSRELMDLIVEEGQDPSLVVQDTRIMSKDYRLTSIDLTASRDVIDNVFQSLNIDYNAPTMFISECVIVYIPTECGNTLIKWAADRFAEAAFITYEQIKPYDEFGAMMIKNIENKGCPLLSITSFPEIKDQRNRYLSLGWKRVDVLDMLNIYNQFITKERRKETEVLEIFDEFEEWNMIQGHYCFVLAIKSVDQSKTVQYHFEQQQPMPTLASGTNTVSSTTS
ncbi:hypothetical protein SAMD00019534_051650, partial [Acytostelium subglobosum LB1]|uniref:hypothetical protein n=1 Tax=Acytostelium subglobosum LB1 TaxID=1410327 RepID=UPI000644E6DD